MPICPQCGRSVATSELKPVGNEFYSLRCGFCIQAAEGTMSAENISRDCKPILNINIDEVDHNGGKDYRVSARIHYGGLCLEFDKTVDEMRRFFTERRLRQEEKLSPVPSPVPVGSKNRLKTV